MRGRRWLAIGLAIAGLALAVEAGAQPRGPAQGNGNGPAQRARGGDARPQGPGGRVGMPSPEGRTVAEVEQLFDRYVMAQARRDLRLTPDQARAFTPRLQRLQQTRRRALRQQQLLIRELGELTRASNSPDEDALTAKLAALESEVAAAEQQVNDAYRQVEGVLSVEQRARLRVFEQRMARQKLQLMARARELAQTGGQTPPADADSAQGPPAP